MRTPFIAGNWKMNLNHMEAIKFIEELSYKIENKNNIKIAVCPSFTSIRSVILVLEDESKKNIKMKIKVGAQNMYFEDNGAYTGEVSPQMLKALGVEYVIIGHSERRELFGETDESVNKKLKTAFKYEIKPILCVGETLKIREEGRAIDFTIGQIRKDLKDITADKINNLTIAYEPIWAIGTGRNATPKDANEMCMAIRNEISILYGSKTAENLIIQYGGSVKPSNIGELMMMPDIDGALVGGASIKVDDFLAIVNY
ncbi:MAG: triose-phosphate isomerase [Actinobacteria bacterium]|nr:triose-phosphate isomerase [Actinomycetota bacterium]MCL6087546.1 triose-phosphate isomerase [Actinomycetota bacterium]